jgi:hypothetical protein
MMTARLVSAAALVAACAVLPSAGCSDMKRPAGFSDAGRFTKTPNSCALISPEIVERLTGASVPGKRIDDRVVAEIQECSWANDADVGHPEATFGQVTVFVDRGTANSTGNGVQSIENVYGKELKEGGCAPLNGLAVDQSCVFPGSGIRLVAFRTSNLFVRVTCSVRNPDPCSGAQRSATAELLAKTVLQKL